MKTKYREGCLFKQTKNGWETFNCKHYHKCKKDKNRKEYTIDEFKHKIYSNITKAYYECPWHNIKHFIHKGNKCTVKSITIVFDAGYVLRLNYESRGEQHYCYIKNINSLKYLRLLKLKDITILE